jgi:membrane protein DedA with SNARE-associated domain
VLPCTPALSIRWTSVGSSPPPQEEQSWATISASGWAGNSASQGHLIGLDARKRILGRYLFARHGMPIVFFGRFVALLRAFAALLAGTNGLAPWRFFVSNAAGGIVWATIFGLGGYLFGAGIHRIAGPVGWALLSVALIVGFVMWRYYKKHEDTCWPRPSLRWRCKSGAE